MKKSSSEMGCFFVLLNLVNINGWRFDKPNYCVIPNEVEGTIAYRTRKRILINLDLQFFRNIIQEFKIRILAFYQSFFLFPTPTFQLFFPIYCMNCIGKPLKVN
jgi:hypothetical protein